jgi:hypothetical protein
MHSSMDIPTTEPPRRKWESCMNDLSGRGSLPRIVLCLVIGLGAACRTTGEWSVVSRREARKMTEPCSRGFPEELTGYWRPGADDIARAERALPRAIDVAFAELRAGGEDPRPPARYWRQYAGFSRGGKRVLYVHAIGTSNDAVPDDAWPDHYVQLCDGWIQSFGAVYDPATDAFDSFAFNGSLPLPPPPPSR